MESDRGEQDDQSRRARQKAGRDPDPEDAFRRQLVAGVVMVAVAVVVMRVAVFTVIVIVVIVIVFLAAPPAKALPEHRRADRDDEKSGGKREPGIEPLGKDELREGERHDADREHAGGVCDRHRSSQQHRVAWRSLRADQIGGHERLAVSRCKRVCGAPESGDQERKEEDAYRDVALARSRPRSLLNRARSQGRLRWSAELRSLVPARRWQRRQIRSAASGAVRRGRCEAPSSHLPRARPSARCSRRHVRKA